MSIPSRQIGWGQEEILLQNIAKQLNRLISVTSGTLSKYFSLTGTNTLVGNTTLATNGNSLSITGLSNTPDGVSPANPSLSFLTVDANGLLTTKTSNIVGDVNFSSRTTSTAAIGTITLVNGSATVIGTGTNFLDSSSLGFSFWLGAWVYDGVTWYRMSSPTGITATSMTVGSFFSLAQAIAGYVNKSTTFPGVSGTYTWYIVRDFSDNYGFVVGSNNIANNYSAVIGSGDSAASGGNSAVIAGNDSIATNSRSLATGVNTSSTGVNAFAGGGGAAGVGNIKRILSSGTCSFVHSQNTAATTDGFGGQAANCVILGGQDHNITTAGTKSAIIGGNLHAISAANTVVLGGSSISATQASFVYVPSLNINTAPAALANASGALLGRLTAGNTGNVVTVGLDGGLILTSAGNLGYGKTAAAPATTGTMTTTLTGLSMMTITPTGACTFNASGGISGQRCVFVITTSGSSSFTLTWGTSYKTTATLATGTSTGKVFTVEFAYDGTNWNEVARTTAM